MTVVNEYWLQKNNYFFEKFSITLDNEGNNKLILPDKLL